MPYNLSLLNSIHRNYLQVKHLGHWADEAVLDQEGDGLGQQVIETLDGDLDVLFLVDQHLLVRGGVLTQGGEPIAQAPFGGVVTVLEAETAGVVGKAGVT